MCCVNREFMLHNVFPHQHDTTIVALQEALNIFNGLQPPYASTHLFELHQEQNG